jgi:hypothetical protein
MEIETVSAVIEGIEGISPFIYNKCIPRKIVSSQVYVIVPALKFTPAG